jgi:murein L,D-transpeptidase YafK
MADTARTQRRLTGRASLLAILLLVMVAGAAALILGDRPQLSAALMPVTYSKSIRTAGAPSTPGTIGPKVVLDQPAEALLVKTLAEISQNRMDNALTEIDRVISAYPNFRLAHLIKGDLLLARARPISAIGNIHDAPAEVLDDLREEARARVWRAQTERPKVQVPRYLLQMPPEHRHALVVDTSKSTLYVFENKDGEARYVSDYYVTIGKQGMDKYREGDNKTPLGVYHVTGSLSREQLNASFGKQAGEYGVGALPINYPNEWDRRAGRSGHSIWLHGVPFDTYSRPPRASNGCVALTNEDFMTLSRSVQVGVTPVIIANGIEWSNPEEMRALRADLSQAFEQWRSDWESLNTANYLRHYSSQFAAGTQNYQAWAEYKREVNSAKTWIKVKVDNVSMFFYPGAGELAVMTFEQNYTSSNLSGQTRRRQYWKKEAGGWKILYEGMVPAT